MSGSGTRRVRVGGLFFFCSTDTSRIFSATIRFLESETLHSRSFNMVLRFLKRFIRVFVASYRIQRGNTGS